MSHNITFNADNEESEEYKRLINLLSESKPIYLIESRSDGFKITEVIIDNKLIDYKIEDLK